MFGDGVTQPVHILAFCRHFVPIETQHDNAARVIFCFAERCEGKLTIVPSARRMSNMMASPALGACFLIGVVCFLFVRLLPCRLRLDVFMNGQDRLGMGVVFIFHGHDSLSCVMIDVRVDVIMRGETLAQLVIDPVARGLDIRAAAARLAFGLGCWPCINSVAESARTSFCTASSIAALSSV